mmetsp:Transcript_149894/g.481587  ORF Transcript_149894/g.481587 Transcript_149894/m.481587 type:complete len:220 (+) Transcript_149894:242-901(+)|eukprot:CAMPEP_0203842092 /NCGR_PEP_ID=MMETSP0359-20131031/1780_1 /ASSEMBLY_ACC=CAM_ASM_000338 /TAXON_ID=268821 /ORGANISM="Scrippsiella Hangoei, Strain SHTV-5" /LENGTH=219 /DNA_ID=CAMNT_0050756617 /DNA_START=185 /DNA_END=844 /DNA_ORIENTATION=+
MSLPLPYFSRDVHWNNKTKEARIEGSLPTLKYFAQNLMYPRASGLGLENKSIEYGNLTVNLSTSEIINMYSWEFYARELSTAPSEKALQGLEIMNAVYQALSSGVASKPGGTHIYAGHDGTIDFLRAILNLTWEAPPYYGSPGPTPPTSALMFTRHPDGRVQIDDVYPVLNGSLTPQIRTQAVSPASLSLEEMSKRVNDVLNKNSAAAACAEKLGLKFR